MINIKQLKSSTSGPILVQGSSNVISSSDFTWNDSTKIQYVGGKIGINVISPTHTLDIVATGTNVLKVTSNAAGSYTGPKLAMEVGGGTWNWGFSAQKDAMTALTPGTTIGNFIFGYGTESAPISKFAYYSSYGGFGVNVPFNSISAAGHFRNVVVGNFNDALILADTFLGVSRFIVQNDGFIGIGVNPTLGLLEIKGIDDTSTNSTLYVKTLSGYKLAQFRNDGLLNFLNNDIQMITDGAGTHLQGGNYKQFILGISGIGDYIILSHNEGSTKILTQAVVLGGSIPSGDVSLNVGNYGGISSIGVRNIALSANTSGGATFAIGAKGQGGANGSATMRFSHNPISFGAAGASTNNNYYRIGIGQDDVLTHRVAIADGLIVSGLSTAGAMQIVGGDSTFNNFGLIVYDIALNSNFSVRNDGSSGFGGILANTKVSITGSDSTGTNSALKIHNLAGTLLLQQKNNGIFYLNTTNSNDSQFQLANSGGVGFSILHYSAGNQQMYFDACYESGIIAKNTHSFGILNVGGLLRFGRASGLTPGTGFGYSIALNIDSATGYVGINFGANAATSPLQIGGLPSYATNALALIGGLTNGALYIRIGHGLDIVV